MKNFVKLAFCLVLFSGAIRMGFSRGDKIIPQIVAGPGWSTTLDLTNISSAQAITHMRLAFFNNAGDPWELQTNRGTASSFTLSLQPRQTLRVKAIGGTELGTGYAVIYDEETGNSEFSEDYVLGISVFYQVLSGTGITETVSIPLREATAVAAVPIEINDTQGIYSAVAIVNAAKTSNAIQLTLYDEDGSLYGTKSLSLATGEQRTSFLDYDPQLFPGLKSFKGMAELIAERPFILLSLLQTRAADNNPQYTLLVPVDKESLRRNSYMVLLQSGEDATPYMPLDIDGFTSDFYRTTGYPNRLTESYSWDLEYWYVAPYTENRFFRPVNFSRIASLGIKNDGQFDELSLPDLKALTYSALDLNISTASLNQTFAIRTDLGNYAKARIFRIIDTVGEDTRKYQDLVLEVVVYK